MTSQNWYFKIPVDVRKVFLYYLMYCFGFLLIHLAMISIFTFFHFLLDHDMNTIENWLNRNAWEVLSFSKLTSLYISTRVIKLNLYNDIKLRSYFELDQLIPSKKMIGVILFLLAIFYAFIVQFGGGVVQNQFKEDLFYSSFIGAFMFYTLDFIMIFLLLKIFEIKKEYHTKLMYLTLIMFLVSSKVALPYLDKFYVFLMIHFITLFYLGQKAKLIDVLCYALFIISPLSSIYGLDIVWDNAYSIFTYQKNLPILGVLGIWGIAIGYYHYSKVD
jgi:hypothetical protein